MECSHFCSRSMPISEIARMETTCSSQFSSVHVPHQIFTCFKGVSAKASFASAPKKAVGSSFEQQKLGAAVLGCGISGRNSSLSSRDLRVLDAFDDEYGGVIVDSERLPADPHAFASMLRFSVSHWKAKEKKGIWLKLPAEKSELVPVAVKEGFEYHHAEKGYVMLTYWLPQGPCMLPGNASHQVGVGGFVINDNNEVLVVREKYSAPAFVGLWKIPTGFIAESEEIYTGAVREVKEETGIDTEFLELVAFRHVHNVAFEKSDLFFICMLKPLSTRIRVDDNEIQAAKWMPLVEFVEQPLIKEDCMFKKVIDICIARLGKRYCGLSVHQLASRFDGKISTLYYNVVDSYDINCIGN
ncbi:Nudix hydrolase 8 [Hibiscus syriacus]|uniref:Nudix hydrolase 8 n=1 Tax=Hibiscus syriacus TaxID=106335 RepID=A0A6A2ZDV1_HIBSY|nr:nudix hydrolase 8-like [Hibiscus syriacus]KAE8690204.1 Nudix hydrolase 8 [Hibiscus syriacus]